MIKLAVIQDKKRQERIDKQDYLERNAEKWDAKEKHLVKNKKSILD